MWRWLHIHTINSMYKLNVGSFNTLRPRQNGRRFADDTFKRILLNENVRISIKISLKFVPKGPINNNPALVQIMAWHRTGDKPLSEPMIVSLLTHICVTRPQWVKQACSACYSVPLADDMIEWPWQCPGNWLWGFITIDKYGWPKCKPAVSCPGAGELQQLE